MPPYEIMGVVNVTPDSFSDGGTFEDAAAAVRHARRLVEEGAAIVDVGGESTRPGAEPVPVERSCAACSRWWRASPRSALGARISIDTMKLAVAEAAVEAGATYVNDVTAFRHDPDLAGLVADRGLDCCLMHMLGEPRTMQEDPRYDDVVSDVKAFLEERLAAAVAAGVPEERVQLDPGIGFGKTLEHNLELLRRLDEIAAHRPARSCSAPRASRSSGAHRPRRRRARARDGRHVRARLERGARVFRVHDVAAVARRARRGGCYVAAGWPVTTPIPTRTRTTTTSRSDDEDDEGPEVGVTVEIVGLSLYTHHGVTAAEREIGQRLVLDVRFDVGEPDALITDRVEDTVDYGEVCQVIALIAQQRSYRTLERLCAVIADRLASQFGAESVTVKAAKPEPPIPLPVEEVSVEVWREER